MSSHNSQVYFNFGRMEELIEYFKSAGFTIDGGDGESYFIATGQNAENIELLCLYRRGCLSAQASTREIRQEVITPIDVASIDELTYVMQRVPFVKRNFPALIAAIPPGLLP